MVVMHVVMITLVLLGSAHGYWHSYYDSFDLSQKHGRLRRNTEENGAAIPGTGDDQNSQGSHGNASNGNHAEHEEHHGIHVASWKYEYVRPYFVICIFLITVCLLKLGFHHAHFLSSYIPESCMLILYGTCVGAILEACDISPGFSKLEPDTFFLIILPPIILESSYSLHDRAFMDNMGTIIMYAVLGTLASCFLIGPLLYAFGEINILGGLEISCTECFVFASLIVAVDPVAVLAIFQEVGVEDRLYFLVFGESLLNDAVTVVLYNMMTAFYFMKDIPASQIGMGVAAFFTVSLGGLCIGISFGILTALLTKYTRRVRVVEPLAVLILAYTSYLSAELFHFSGIISIIGCGLIQAQYAFHNIGYKSEVTVKYFIKMLSGTMDSLIFLLLGIAMVSANHVWNLAFIVWAISLCIVVRFAVIFGLTLIANKTYRFKKITLEEQFIMSYGGLRGAVSFSLANMMDSETFEKRNLFETTTLMVIVFTVFFQGTTIKPLVKMLRVTKQEDTDTNKSIFRAMHMHVIDHILAGIEEISGSGGRNAVREKLDYYDNNYFKRWLQRDPQTKDQVLLDAYQDLEMSLRYQSLRAAARGEPCPEDGSAARVVEPHKQGKAFADLAREVQRRRNTLDQATKAAPSTPQNNWQRMRSMFKKEDVAQSQEEDDVGAITRLMVPAKRYYRPHDDTGDDWLRLIDQQQQQRHQRRFRHSLPPLDVACHTPTSQPARPAYPETKPLMRVSPGHGKDDIELVQTEHNHNLDRDERNARTISV